MVLQKNRYDGSRSNKITKYFCEFESLSYLATGKNQKHWFLYR